MLADGPIPQYVYSPTTGAIFAHKEGHTCPIIVADKQLIKARKLTGDLPKSLNNVPFIMPPAESTLAQALREWFDDNGIEPDIIAEANDRVLMVLLAQKGTAAIGISSVVAPSVCELQNLTPVFEIKNPKYHENFFAIAQKRPSQKWAIDRILQRIEDFSKHPPKVDWGRGEIFDVPLTD